MRMTAQERERAEDRRRASHERGWSRLRLLTRVMQLYVDGLSDNEVAAAIGKSRKQVLRLRQMLTLDTSGPRVPGRRLGRLRENVREFVEAFR